MSNLEKNNNFSIQFWMQEEKKTILDENKIGKKNFSLSHFCCWLTKEVEKWWNKMMAEEETWRRAKNINNKISREQQQ